MSNTEVLVQKYEAAKKKAEEIRMQNEMAKQKLQECREEIEALGFNPDNLDNQIENIKAKITERLTEFEGKIDSLLEGLGNGQN